MNQSFSDHFSAVSSSYAAFRPRYPQPLFAWLAEIAPSRQLAWDCATGSGQAAVDLAAHFQQVVATDASPDQIATARPHPQVRYQVALAESSGLTPGTIDIVTVAQALHWFDCPRFFAEVKRVLRPQGVLAAWTYGLMFTGDDAIDAVVHTYYDDIVGPYWPQERALVASGYATIDFPFTPIQPPDFEMVTDWSLSELLGYLGTWSASRRYLEAQGHDPLDRIRAPLAAAWGAEHRPLRWPLALRVGHL